MSKKIHNDILSRLENGITLNELSKEKGFHEGIDYLESNDLIEVYCKPEPGQSSYSTYRITAKGRQFLN